MIAKFLPLTKEVSSEHQEHICVCSTHSPSPPIAVDKGHGGTQLWAGWSLSSTCCGCFSASTVDMEEILFLTQFGVSRWVTVFTDNAVSWIEHKCLWGLQAVQGTDFCFQPVCTSWKFAPVYASSKIGFAHSQLCRDIGRCCIIMFCKKMPEQVRFVC